MDETLEKLANEAKQGSLAAFSEIVSRTQQRLLSYAYPMLGSTQDAEDVVQEVYIRAYQHIGKYRRSDSITAWLYTICYRLCVNRLKKRSSWLNLMPKLRNEAALLDQTGRLHVQDESDLSLLDGLSAADRNLVILRVIHDQTFEEIAKITGKSAPALRKQYERIRKKLHARHMRKTDSDVNEICETRRGVTYDQSV